MPRLSVIRYCGVYMVEVVHSLEWFKHSRWT